jgi:hypothetical protein
MIDSPCVEGGRTAANAMHFISLLQKERGQIGAVLAGYASD